MDDGAMHAIRSSGRTIVLGGQLVDDVELRHAIGGEGGSLKSNQIKCQFECARAPGGPCGTITKYTEEC